MRKKTKRNQSTKSDKSKLETKPPSGKKGKKKYDAESNDSDENTIKEQNNKRKRPMRH